MYHLRERIRELEIANEALGRNEGILAAELETLQRVATQLIYAQGAQAVYEQILDSAIAILNADFASIQMLCPERGESGELRLLGHRGFNEEGAKGWEWVGRASCTTCGEALRTGRRIAVPDVRQCSFMAGSEDLKRYIDAGIQSVQSTPLVSRSGALLGMVSTHWRKPHDLSLSELRGLDILARLAADLIERSRADDNLRSALEQIRLITDNMACGVTRCSRDRRYLWVNRSYAAWLNLTPEEIVGRPILDVLGSDAFEAILPHIQKVLSGETTAFESQIQYRSGVRWVHAVGVPTKSDDQRVNGWIAVLTDVTGARRSQEESFAKQKLESIGTLAAGIAHDFNNLLSAVLAQADLASRHLDAGFSCKEELKIIREVAMRGSEIVRQLMIYAGKESEFSDLVDLSRIVKEMFALLKFSVSKHATLEADLAEDMPTLRANAAQLRQVLMNLIMNASEALGDREGVIRVTTSSANVGPDCTGGSSPDLVGADCVRLEVSDTGRGMTKETQDRVFDPFFTTRATGHGLGLSVVDGIVRGLGGTIHIFTELNHGTTFQVLLPCIEATPDTDGLVQTGLAEPTRVQNCSILVVEDEDSLRQAIVEILRKLGYLVLEAANGSAAIDFLHANRGKIDVILLDMTIPGATSQQVLHEAMQCQLGIRVVLTSAYSYETVRAHLDAPQTSVFIRKPFQLEDLIQKIQALAPISRARQAGVSEGG